MKTASTIGLLVGIAVIIALVVWQGFDLVSGPLATAGWSIVLLVLFYLPHLVFGTMSWRLLFADGRAPGFGRAIYVNWIGGSVNWLLPVASIGGEVVKARLLMQRAISGADAGASVVVDKTVQALSVLLWVLIGLCILVSLTAEVALLGSVLAGFALFAVGIFVFLAIQRAGAFGLLAGTVARATGSGMWHRLAGKADELDGTIRALYDRPGRIALAVLLRLAARVALAGEVWFAAALMGHPISLVEAVMLKSLTAAVRSAAFAVPGGLGFQEGGYMVIGALIGQPPGLMLSISLATRVRELLVGVPGLLAWQQAEGRTLWTRRQQLSE